MGASVTNISSIVKLLNESPYHFTTLSIHQHNTTPSQHTSFLLLERCDHHDGADGGGVGGGPWGGSHLRPFIFLRGEKRTSDTLMFGSNSRHFPGEGRRGRPADPHRLPPSEVRVCGGSNLIRMGGFARLFFPRHGKY